MQFLFTRFWPTHHGLRPEGARRQHRVLSRHSFLVPLSFSAPLFLLQLALPAYPQDTRTAETQTFGRGVSITVVVHDPSGELISAPAIVKLFRGSTMPAGQAQTSRGVAELSVIDLGEFTVVVEVAGYPRVEKEFSVDANGRSEVDVYLRQAPGGAARPAPGRPLLAPKAKKALDQASQSLSVDKLSEAGQYINEAVRLAPGHPDVLYLQGVLLLKQRQWAKAQEALEKSTQLDPAHAQAFAALGMALCDQGKYDAAIAPLEKSQQLNSSSSWDTRWALAKAYYQRARYDEALQMSEAALSASNGKAPEIQLLVAQSLTAVGRYEDAAQTLRDFLRGHSDRQEAAIARRWLDRLSSSGKIGNR
jgi:Flp pilus assembly protein TadD